MAQNQSDKAAAVAARIGKVTTELLSEGLEPSLVAFVLTSVAADMGFRLNDDPLRALPVLLGAICAQATSTSEPEFEDAEGITLPAESTLH